MQISLTDEVELRARFVLSKERIEAEARKQKEQRQADRKAGRITPDIYDRLRALTIPQLRESKKLCDRFVQDQKRAPSANDCFRPYTVKVLFSACVRNKRFQYEIIRSTKRAEKLYFNGPYMRAYWRDGRIIKRQHFKPKDYPKLPRAVRAVLMEYLSVNDPKEMLANITAKNAT